MEMDLGTPVLAIALVLAVVALSVLIRSYHKRNAFEDPVIQEDPETIVS